MLCGSLVTTAWRVRRLRLEVSPPGKEVAANMFNKHSRTADKAWSSRWGLGVGPQPFTVKTFYLLRNVSKGFGPGLILWYELSIEKTT
jgi:hypothetical protein